MPESDISFRLRRLWKGAIYVGIAAIYVLLVGMMLLFRGWRTALLALFLIGLAQLFRHIANEVDRLGWVMEKEESTEDHTDAHRYQAKMLIALFTLIQLANVGIIYQVFVVSSWIPAMIVTGAVLLMEIMFKQIRIVNHRIDYGLASYGINDARPILGGVGTQQRGVEQVDARLAKLKNMAQAGEISQKAYEKARDRALVERVMEE